MNIPKIVADSEKIVRLIFSPINVNPRTQNVRTNIFKSPPNKDEVSVLRLQFTDPDFCKSHGKKIEDPGKNRNFYGFAVIDAYEVRSVKADVISSPNSKDKLEMHADIKVGHKSIRNKTLPPNISFKIDELIRLSRYFPDPDPESKTWKGKSLK